MKESKLLWGEAKKRFPILGNVKKKAKYVYLKLYEPGEEAIIYPSTNDYASRFFHPIGTGNTDYLYAGNTGESEANSPMATRVQRGPLTPGTGIVVADIDSYHAYIEIYYCEEI